MSQPMAIPQRSGTRGAPSSSSFAPSNGGGMGHIVAQSLPVTLNGPPHHHMHHDHHHSNNFFQGPQHHYQYPMNHPLTAAVQPLEPPLEPPLDLVHSPNFMAHIPLDQRSGLLAHDGYGEPSTLDHAPASTPEDESAVFNRPFVPPHVVVDRIHSQSMCRSLSSKKTPSICSSFLL